MNPRDQAHPIDYGPWVPYFETSEFQYLGDPWPRYVVTMWERNTIGETRMVRSRIYGPDDVGTTEATGSIASIEETHGAANVAPASILDRVTYCSTCGKTRMVEWLHRNCAPEPR